MELGVVGRWNPKKVLLVFRSAAGPHGQDYVIEQLVECLHGPKGDFFVVDCVSQALFAKSVNHTPPSLLIILEQNRISEVILKSELRIEHSALVQYLESQPLNQLTFWERTNFEEGAQSRRPV